MRAKIQLLPKSAKCFYLFLPKSAKCCMGSHECYLIFSHHLLGICHFAISGILYTFDSSLGSYHRASEDYPSGADGHSRYFRPFCFGTTYLL